ncbi:hypothetical protein [Kibdelosporangium phytohabitans]|nr:hypothetical protein [Kibdelosporangium phytohabitans]MBE1470704.1 hypothetical protein [Kibdelosporangium phytohabitans]
MVEQQASDQSLLVDTGVGQRGQHVSSIGGHLDAIHAGVEHSP